MQDDYKQNWIYYVMLVPIEAGKTNKEFDFENMWERFRSLPKSIRKILNSEKLVDFIYGISKHFNLNDDQTEEFSRTIRRYFFGEIVDGQFARVIGNLCNTSSEEGLSILNSIKNIRVENEVRRNLVTGELYTPSPVSSTISSAPVTNYYSSQSQKVFQSKPKEIVNPSNLSKMPIKRALKLYPKLENQLFTGTAILSKKYLKPINPTIKNWLVVYEDFTGTGKKTAIERGNFLFQSDVCRNLTTEEKQKLANLLKSVDEDFPLLIDGNKAQVVFLNFSSNSSESSNFNTNSSISSNEEVLIENEPDSFPNENQSGEENNFSAFPVNDDFTEESVDNSIHNFSSNSYGNELKNENIEEKNFSPIFSISSDENEVKPSQQEKKLQDKFFSSSNFNDKAFSNLYNPDFSQSNSLPEKDSTGFSLNYSIDDLEKTKNNSKLEGSFFPDFSQPESNFFTDDGNLSFTSKHVLPVEKSLLEKSKND